MDRSFRERGFLPQRDPLTAFPYGSSLAPLDRIAQMVFVPIARPTFTVVDEFEEKTARGEGGFGSTGV